MSHNTAVINNKEPNADSTYGVLVSTQMILVGRGEAQTYDTSGGALTIGSACRFYDSSPLNTIEGSTLSGSNGWYDSVTLPAGRYLLRGYFSALFSASGSLGFGFYNGSSYVGGRAYIGATATAPTDGASFANAQVTLTSSTTLTLVIYAATNVASVASQGNVPSEESWLCIERQA